MKSNFVRTWLWKYKHSACPVRRDAALTAAAYWMVESHMAQDSSVLHFWGGDL